MYRYLSLIILSGIMAAMPMHAGMNPYDQYQPYNSYNPNNLGGSSNQFANSRYNPNPNPVIPTAIPVKGFAALAGSVPQEMIEFANHFKDANISVNNNYGINPPRGIFLVGQTGSGKTSIAKALAEELDCPFVYQSAATLSGDAIQEIFDAARNKAKSSKHKKTVLFIDDLDLFANPKLSNDAIALLNEMDGFAKDDSVIVIGACERVENFEKQFLRSGRFDKVIEMQLPNPAERAKMLRKFNQDSKIPFDSRLNLTIIAQFTYNFTPADLKELINYAHIFAKRDQSLSITQKHMIEAVIKVLQAKGRINKDLSVRVKTMLNLLNNKKDEKKGFARLVGNIPDEITELVKQIKNDEVYKKYGLELPKGILLSGPPGTGKTSLVRALSEEAGCEFMTVSGAEFVDPLVGGGAQKIRDLFKEARQRAANSEAKKTIIFIDELDAIGKRQGNSLDATVTELLTQMDGFEEDNSVIVIAASNHPNNIDQALLRPGRFSKIIKIGVPDLNKREQVLNLYTNGIPLDPDVDLKKIAEATNNFSPAELKELVQEAAALALKQGFKSLKQKHFVEAIKKALRARMIKGEKDIQQQMDALDVIFGGKASTKGFKQLVGAIDPAIEDLVKMIKGEYNYTAFGVPFPKGVLLAGPPGTGKTALARAVAQEANCGFIEAKGSEFIEKYVGVGAQRVRDLFNEARTKAEGSPSGKTIIFIDEIDAIGSRSSSDNSETSRTITELLTQMDGFYKDESVIVMAATNAPNLLDPALLRAGRFDTIIEVPLPDFQKRKALFVFYCKGKPVDPTISFDNLAREMEGANAADIKNLVDKAAQLAMRARQTIIAQANFDQALKIIKAAEDRKNNGYLLPDKVF